MTDDQAVPRSSHSEQPAAKPAQPARPMAATTQGTIEHFDATQRRIEKMRRAASAIRPKPRPPSPRLRRSGTASGDCRPVDTLHERCSAHSGAGNSLGNAIRAAALGCAAAVGSASGRGSSGSGARDAVGTGRHSNPLPPPPLRSRQQADRSRRPSWRSS